VNFGLREVSRRTAQDQAAARPREKARSEYADDISDDTLIEGAINGMLISLDSHSVDPSIMGTADDYQLARAVDMLRDIALFSGRVVN
jgi:hypothetical protein